MQPKTSGPDLANLTAQLNELREKAGQLFMAGRFADALEVARQGLGILYWPPFVEQEICCLSRLGRYDEAMQIAEHLPEDKRSANFFDILSEIYGELGVLDKVRLYGSRSLAMKNQQTLADPGHELPRETPPRFDPQAINIIAFSLFGDKARYCECAILNCQAVAQMLPGWTCRFYVDETVPDDVLRRIAAAGGELCVLETHVRQIVHPLMWRFVVVDDEKVARYLIRDADSVIAPREVAAIAEWLASDKWFHVMRDSTTHSELILAGMWGGCGGIAWNMQAEVPMFMAAGEYAATHADQHFLRFRVWPTMRKSVLSHDEIFDYPGNRPFPPCNAPRRWQDDHVGANFGFPQISGEVDVPDGTALDWTLLNEAGDAVCSYRVLVQSGSWEASLPFSYARKLADGIWKIRALPRLDPAIVH
ncbi:hypothetical protein FPY71_16525 [Aureimonas fodinaquatilis]|uniref:Uncharacterized protein n=1 Tax=Aureimonas fodinaquatilis TaxID=2565783 RepID=A0A5B0DP10_9HYPH|nr:hypothetical protein [Aureimonas fodinaquatilis]KAA0968494.1 hypothetical protein FPY71_16525 [Aureimonas fodinaquatilis]